MRKLIRALLKLPLTPFFLVASGMFLIAMTIILFFEWVYEAEEYEIEDTKRTLVDCVRHMKKWFTTI